MEAYELKDVDLHYRMHAQAFLNFAVKAMRKAGKNKQKPVYSRFDKFFDYEKEIRKAKERRNGKKDRFSGIGKLLRKEGT